MNRKRLRLLSKWIALIFVLLLILRIIFPTQMTDWIIDLWKMFQRESNIIGNRLNRELIKRFDSFISIIPLCGALDLRMLLLFSNVSILERIGETQDSKTKGF